MGKNELPIYVCAISIMLFAGLTVFVLSGNSQNINTVIYNAVALCISPLMTVLMTVISGIGAWYFYVPVLLILLISQKTRFRYGVPLTLAISASALLNALLKHAFAVPRPEVLKLATEGGYGFPSGHAMNGTVLWGLFTYLFIRYSNQKAHKITVAIFSSVLMILMGLSRIYLGVHTLMDVLGGYLAGSAVLMVGIRITKVLKTTKNNNIIKKWNP